MNYSCVINGFFSSFNSPTFCYVVKLFWLFYLKLSDGLLISCLYLCVLMFDSLDIIFDLLDILSQLLHFMIELTDIIKPATAND